MAPALGIAGKLHECRWNLHDVTSGVARGHEGFRIEARVLRKLKPQDSSLRTQAFAVNVPLLRRLPARLIGVGVRPEHVRPELRAAATGCAGSEPGG
jgi:hypothetical protein